MKVITVTIAATDTAQPIITRDAVVQHPEGFQFAVFQYTSANAMYIGDATVSAAAGFPLKTATPFQVWTPQGYTEDLNGWYVYGTENDVLTILVIQ